MPFLPEAKPPTDTLEGRYQRLGLILPWAVQGMGKTSLLVLLCRRKLVPPRRRRACWGTLP